MIVIISLIGDLTAISNNSATDYYNYTRPNTFAAKFNKFNNVNRSHPILISKYATIKGNRADPLDLVD